MNKAIVILLTCLLWSWQLVALELRYPEGKARAFSLQELRQASQTAFETVREKGSTRQTDLWEGIDLLPWMRSINADNWHSLTFTSIDGFSVSMHRAELEAMPSFIALRDRDGYLAEDALRLIFPQRRDNVWVRGIAAIELNGFDPLPPPRQVFVWEDAISSSLSTRSSQDSISLAEVMQRLFRLDSGSVVFAGMSGNVVRLEYPAHLANAVLNRKDGAYSLGGGDLPPSVCPRDIVYMQCGPQAFILAEALPLLNDLGKYLRWDSVGKAVSMWLVTPSKQAFQPEDGSSRPLPGSWIELR